MTASVFPDIEPDLERGGECLGREEKIERAVTLVML
jgi:hypothetical protein